MKKLLPLFILALLAACSGDFDQRVDVARKVGPGAESIGSTTNPAAGPFITGNIGIAGVVRGAHVTLRPVRDDGQIERDDSKNLGVGISLDNGAYQVNLRDGNYRGAIVVEVRGRDVGGAQTTGFNPATATSSPTHIMRDDHVFYTVAPNFEGKPIFGVHVTPLTTYAVTRGEFFGGASAGMFGLMCQQVGEFFGLPRVRAGMPSDFAATFSFGEDFYYGAAVTALSQVAATLGVANVFDFYQGMALDGRDDGLLNGSIGFVPNTGVVMPNLSAPNLIGNAFLNDYLAPGNLERKVGFDNSAVTPGSGLDVLVGVLNSTRNINNVSRAYGLIVRVPDYIELLPGQQVRTSIFAIEQLDGAVFEAYGASNGPSFVAFNFSSSSPGDVSIQPFGRIVADSAAAPGFYNVTLMVQPAAAQTFVSGPTLSFTITVRVK